MVKFNELLSDLNFYDYSVGIAPIDDTKAANEILEEFNISPILVTNERILFLDNEQHYKLYLDDEWKIERYFDVSKLEEDVLQRLSDLDKDIQTLECFGQLLFGIKNWYRLVKNKKYNTYFVDMYIGEKRLQFNGEFLEVTAEIKKWFNTF